jgi:hypothetical protein
MKRAAFALAAALLAATTAGAQPPVGADAYDAGAPVPGFVDVGPPGPLFYPEGYDPQYGSGGRVPDAEDFAAGYGCRPIWNAKTGTRMPACNRR